MDLGTTSGRVRRPRFHRAAEPLAFRITEGDVEIVRLLARHRFLRSTHIAALVGRSLDRVNDRLLRLFHAGYVNRPRAQLDRYPDSGSAPMVYALANRGAQLLAEHSGPLSNSHWSRKNESAGRPFIKHQLEVMDFYVALRTATRGRHDVTMIHPDEMIADFPQSRRASHHPFALRVMLTQGTGVHDVGVVPDLAFGLRFPDGTRRCFLVEIDCGTMPIVRADPKQTSFGRKLRSYLAAHTARLHERQFGWKTFRVLTVTPSESRMFRMIRASQFFRDETPPGPRLFHFAVRNELHEAGAFQCQWLTGEGIPVAIT